VLTEEREILFDYLPTSPSIWGGGRKKENHLFLLSIHKKSHGRGKEREKGGTN